MSTQQSDVHLKFICPRCSGRWKAREDAKNCHGMEPCTKGADCAAISHFGDCKSMPSADHAASAAREFASKLLKDIDNLSTDDGHSLEFKTGFHRGVLAARAAVKKALGEPEAQRAYWRQNQRESRQRRARSERR